MGLSPTILQKQNIKKFNFQMVKVFRKILKYKTNNFKGLFSEEIEKCLKSLFKKKNDKE